MRLLLALPMLVLTGAFAMWLSPGERAHKAEFMEAYEQRFGPAPANNPPVAMLKTWFRQWKSTKIAPGPWLDANAGQQAPPAGGSVAGGGAPGGSNV